MKKMTMDQNRFFGIVVRAAFNGECYVYFFRNNRSEDHRWGVNWSCCGTQDTESANEFMSRLSQAIALADELNARGISGDIDYDAEDVYQFTSEEDYDSAIKCVVNMIRDGFIAGACDVMFEGLK